MTDIEDVTQPRRRKRMIPASQALPEIEPEWYSEKNCGWSLGDFSHASAVRAWWICGRCRRPFKQAIEFRILHKSGCPFCAHRAVCFENSLAALFPVVAAEWHPTANGDLTPFELTAHSSRAVWWQCPQKKDHVWECKVGERTRTNGRECSCCADENKRPFLDVSHPNIAATWHSKKNKGLSASKLTAVSRRVVWWQCAENDSHQWRQRVDVRIRNECPHCKLARNSLAKLFPEVALDLHATKNGELTAEFLYAHSQKKVYWQCRNACGYVWQAIVGSRTTNGRGCPRCAGKIADHTNSLAALRPDISAQWHPRLNGNLTPDDVTCHSGRKVWWFCSREKHEWQATVAGRSEGKGCQRCFYVNEENCLQNLRPDLAAEWAKGKNRYLFPLWDPKTARLAPLRLQKNRRLRPSDVAVNSKEAVWWQCTKSAAHLWVDRIANRTRNDGSCPFCTGIRVAVDNNLAVTDPAVAKAWHPTKNTPVTPHDVTARMHVNAYWRCFRSASHAWEESVHTVVGFYRRGRTACPCCRNLLVCDDNSLLNLQPRAAEFWHPTRNLPLTPARVLAGTQQSFWWQCPRGIDHVWAAPVANVVHGQKFRTRGCPFCAGRRLSRAESLHALNPEVVAYWDKARNLSLQPKKVSASSSKVVFWHCKKSGDHVWKARVKDMVQRWQLSPTANLCRFCAGS